jgi:hypothetical protein
MMPAVPPDQTTFDIWRQQVSSLLAALGFIEQSETPTEQSETPTDDACSAARCGLGPRWHQLVEAKVASPL